jgi:hypothetical protein
MRQHTSAYVGLFLQRPIKEVCCKEVYCQHLSGGSEVVALALYPIVDGAGVGGGGLDLCALKIFFGSKSSIFFFILDLILRDAIQSSALFVKRDLEFVKKRPRIRQKEACEKASNLSWC